MNPSNPKTKLNIQIYEEACEWLVHFRAGDADDDVAARARLDEWLRRSPDHVRAYLEVSTIWEDTASHDAERKIDAAAHIARALSERNVYPLDAEIAHAKAGITSRRSTPARRFALAVAASALFAVALASTWVISQRNVYATDIGEQRSFRLDDGSSVELNARSRLRVKFTAGQRSVELLEGQALFRVAKDASRPFVVSTHDTIVRAVGTQFDVNRRKADTTITVLEGRVGVSAGSALEKSAEVFLDAGQQLVATPETLAQPRTADISAATAWTSRRLVFDSAPLRDVAEEFNRYNERPIVIADAELESFGVIGVFSSADPTALLAFLRAQPEMSVAETDSSIVISRK